MTPQVAWSEWRYLMLESDYLKALHVGYLPFEVETPSGISDPLRFCRRGLVAERAHELRDPDLETGKVVSLAWQSAFFNSQTQNLIEPKSDTWDLNLAMPLSADLHKLGLESLDREQVIEHFFADPEVFKDMVHNIELDSDLTVPYEGARITAIGEVV